MRRASLRVRLAIWSFVSITTVSVLLSAYYYAHMQQLLEREADARIASLARYLATSAKLGVLAANEEMLAATVESALAAGDVVGVGIYDAAGNRLAGGGEPMADSPGPGRCAPCAAEAERLRWVEPVTRQAPRDEAFFGGASAAAEVAGAVVLTVSSAARHADARSLLWRGIFISGGVLLVGLAIMLFVAARLTAPVRALAQATQRIALGHSEVQIPADSPRELRDLAEDFRAMADKLQAHRDELEDRVAKRTAELSAANAELVRLNAEKDQFVSTVSHDFRSPLAIILASVQTLLADAAIEPDKRKKLLERAERQCRRLQTLVGDLLDLARIEHREAELADTALAELVADQIDAMKPVFEERGVSLSAEGAAVARVDRPLLERALGNLLDNALKFTPAPGRVHVRLAEERDGLGARWARLRVTDSGLGIPESDIPRLCERFFQCERDASKGEGSGLGLAIVAEVAKKHGGRVEIESRLGAGTTFSVVLPCAKE